MRHRKRPARLVAILGAVLLASSAELSAQQATTLAPTPSQTEGPFYPRTLPADRDNDLTMITGRTQGAQGVRLYFDGRVLGADGTPVAGVLVELWQCDAFGRYHYVGDDGEPRDDNFQGYGTSTTDAAGRYAFKTIRPVPYSGRIPHLHFRIRTPDGRTLTTQLYIKGDASTGDPVLAMSPAGTLAKLTLAVAPLADREPGALTGRFDFVLR